MWMTLLAILGWFGFAIAVLVAIALNLLGLFGNWIILAAVAIVAVLTGFGPIGWPTLIALAGLAVLGEIFEMAASGLGAARYGGGKGAFVAALIGTIAGGIIGTGLLPIIGTVIGACIGAFALAMGYEWLSGKQNLSGSARVGTGAAIGKIGGIIAKTTVGFVMLGIFAIAYWT